MVTIYAAQWVASSPEADRSTWPICTRMYDSFLVRGGGDHSRCTRMSQAMTTTDLQIRLIAGCATVNKIDSRTLP
jgi:hypothetical protein